MFFQFCTEQLILYLMLAYFVCAQSLHKEKGKWSCRVVGKVASFVASFVALQPLDFHGTV